MQVNLVLAVMHQYPFEHGRKENVHSFQHAPPLGLVETDGGLRGHIFLSLVFNGNHINVIFKPKLKMFLF